MQTLRVGLVGFGSVGQELANRLIGGAIPGMLLTTVTARDLDKARLVAQNFERPPLVVSLDELLLRSDIVVECATADAFPEIARKVLAAGKTMVTVSVAGLPNCPDLLGLAEGSGGCIHVASGALPGMDIIRGVREGQIHSVKLRSSIRPDSLGKEPYIRNKGFDFTVAPASPVQVFQGTAREAAAAFPRHFNVAITLSLGGIGLDRTQVEVVADASIPGPVHHIEVESEDASLTLISRNRASRNPRTARLVAPSILAALRSYVTSLRVGT